MDNELDYDQIDNIINKTRKFNDDYLNDRDNQQTDIEELNPANASNYIPSFEEILSGFKKIIQDADNEVSRSLKNSESIRSFEVKRQGIPRLNSNNSSKASTLSVRINTSRSSVLSDSSNSSLQSNIPLRRQNTSRTIEYV